MTINDTKTGAMSRRAMLRRMGLAAGAAYVAPVMAGLDAARASGNSGNSGNSGGSAPSARSAPSAKSAPSRAKRSAPTRAKRSVSTRARSNARPAREARRATSDTPRWMWQLPGMR